MLYVPEAFAERDLDTLHHFIAAHGFATLISPDSVDPHITHLPLLLDANRGERGVLIGHVARANPHWQVLVAQPQTIAVFHGPHSYVSPACYRHHPSVPTWNYAVVHAHGRGRLIEDAAVLERVMHALVREHERGRPNPWQMDLPKDYQDGMLRGVVGFEIEIVRLTGKFKLSQNRPLGDVPRVIEALAAGAPEDQAVAALMRRRQR